MAADAYARFWFGLKLDRPKREDKAIATIFVSHASGDKITANQLIERLRAAGYNLIFLDTDPEQGIQVGQTWEQVIYARLQSCDAVIFLNSHISIESKWCFAELALARSTGKPIFPLRIDAAVNHPLLADIQWLDLAKPTDESFDRLWAAMRRRGIDPRESFSWDPQRSPYPGLRAFQDRDAGVFFGRDREIDMALSYLRHGLGQTKGKCIAIIGPSGSGKSSIVRAGIIPRLQRLTEEWTVVPPFRPTDGRTPLEALARRIAALEEARSQLNWRDLLSRMRKDPLFLIDTLRDVHASRGAPDARALIVIDQAEELTTRNEPAQRTEFLEFLVEIMAADRLVWAVATVRSEFLTAVLRDPQVQPLLGKEILVSPIHPTNIPEIIQAPARRAGVVFQPLVVNRIVEEVQGGDAVPLIAYALRGLYETVKDRPIRIVSMDDYMALGEGKGLLGALAAHADATVERLMHIKEFVFPTLLKLVNLDPYQEPTRRRVKKSLLSDIELEVIDEFVEQRLLTSTTAPDGSAVVEATHEALLRAWPPLRSLIENTRSDLLLRSEIERTAHDWELAGRRVSYALRGDRLTNAMRLADEQVFADAPTVLEFIRDSVQHDVQIGMRSSEQLASSILSSLTEDPERGIRSALATIEDYPLTAKAMLALNSALDTSRTRGILYGHTAPLLSIAWSPNSLLVATSGEDGSARVWDAQTSRMLHLLSGHTGFVGSVCFSPDGASLLTASQDGTVRVWSAASGNVINIIQGHNARVRSACFSPCGTNILTASEDGTARIWQAQTGQQRRILQGHDDILIGSAYSPDGETVATTSADFTARIWDVESGQCLKILRGHTDWVRSPAFSPDGRELITASEDGTARVWNIENEVERNRLSGHHARVRSVSFSPDGKYILTGSGDSSARLWDASDMREILALRGHSNRIRCCAFSADGLSVATASEDGTARIWSVRTDSEESTIAVDGKPFRSAYFSPIKSEILIASQNGSAYIFSSPEDHRLVLDGHADRVADAQYSWDGRLIATASSDHSVGVWNADTGVQIERLEGHTDWVRSVCISQDGQYLASASSDQTVRVWKTDDYDYPIILRGHTGYVIDVAFSPQDSNLVVSASSDRSVRVWDIRTGENLLVLTGHEDWVRSAEFSPNGELIVSSSEDATARIWAASSGEEMLILRGHEDWVRTAAFSPDGKRIVTASGDHTARVWDAETGEIWHILRGHTDMVCSAHYSGSGDSIITASLDGTCRIWRDLDIAATKEFARSRIFPPPLRPDQAS